ncbi:MAG: hypothetical protein ACRD2U_12550 [Terriglobales bacterium]
MSLLSTNIAIPWRAILLLALAAISIPAAVASQKSPAPAVVRWTAGTNGSSYLRTADGKYVYDLINGPLEIALAIDAQELEKVHHRPLPILAIRLDARYNGQKSFQFTTGHIALEFLSHYQVVNTALDPDELETRIQNDIDSLSDETAREVRRHPEKKQELESSLQAHLKDMTDLVGFVTLYTLRPAALDSGNPTAGGWIFFSTKSKWIGKWKSHEEFILRVPVRLPSADEVFEFPFALPPHKGDLVLRRRPD